MNTMIQLLSDLFSDIFGLRVKPMSFTHEEMRGTKDYLARMGRRGVEYMRPSEGSEFTVGCRVGRMTEGRYEMLPPQTGDFIPNQVKVAVFEKEDFTTLRETVEAVLLAMPLPPPKDGIERHWREVEAEARRDSKAVGA
jgi:hypothetical protein